MRIAVTSVVILVIHSGLLTGLQGHAGYVMRLIVHRSSQSGALFHGVRFVYYSYNVIRRTLHVSSRAHWSSHVFHGAPRTLGPVKPREVPDNN